MNTFKRTGSSILSCLLILSMLLSVLVVPSFAATSLDSRVEAAIQWAISIANDNSHGYSQANRNGPDYDCSSFVSTAFKKGGFSVSGSLNTSSMKAAFEKAGFTSYKKGDVSIQRGDILLKPGSHVELYLGDNTCVAAHSDYDGKTGDGNGKEIQVRTKNYCTFCKQANYTYVLRYNGKTTNSYTYSFNFNANGGSLGTTGAFTTSYGKEFQILNTTCTRSGYTWAGWNVKRNNDNKWYVAGKGWCTDSQISSNGYTKKVYSNYQTCTLDDSWINGLSGNGSYTFYAVWVRERDTRIMIFMSPYGQDVDHITAKNAATGSGYAQDWIYPWYVIYDLNTGALYNTYEDKNYAVELSIYDPNGNLVHSYNYTDSPDANWIGIKPQMSGTYTAKAVLTGDISATVSTSYTVSYDADLISSRDTISLNLNGTNQVTTTFTPIGGYPGNMGVSYSYDHSIIEKVSGSWSNDVFSLTVKGLKCGSTNIVMNLYENYMGNKNVVATVTVPVTVTADKYTITYNANGGIGAPVSQTKTYGQPLTLSSTKPTRTGYTFLAWSTSSSATSPIYYAGDSYTANTGATLYAVWKADTYTVSYNANGGTGAPSSQTKTYGQPLTLSSTKPTRAGYTFLGWSTNSSATIATYQPGTSYNNNENVTLYAVWEKSGTIYGKCGDKVSYIYKLDIGFVNIQPTFVNSDTYENVYDFDGDTNIKSVVFQAGVSSVGNYMFRDCSALQKLDFYSTNGDAACIQSIGICAFMGCSSLTEVILPDGLKTIKTLAFSDSGLKEITVPKSVTQIDVGAFDSDVTICGYINSAAEQYAKANGNKFIALDAPKLTSISIATMPSQTEYQVGDALFNLFGLTVELKYSDNSTKIISSGFEADGFDTLTAGMKTITVSYEDKTTSFNVYVKEKILLGDLNGDGTIDAGDAVIISRYDAGEITLTADQLKAGDVNGDGIVDAGDAVIISRYDAGLIHDID